MHWHSIQLVTAAFLHSSASSMSIPWDNAENLFLRRDIDGDDGFGPDNFTVCDYSAKYNSLSELQIAMAEVEALPGLLLGGSWLNPKGTWRADCVATYALDALITMLDTAYNNYTVVNDGYDQEFDFYITYMKKTVASVIDNSFMFNTAAATDTENIAPTGPGMKFFDCQIDGEDSSFPCTEVTSLSNYQKMATKTTKMTLKDKDGYLAALEKAGISPDWVHLGSHTVTKEAVEPRAGRKFQYQFTGYPVEEDNMSIPNPKDIVTKALPSIPSLRTEMQATLMDMMLGNWASGTSADAAYAYSTPVFMLMQAIESMAQAKALGQKEQKAEEEAEKNLIVMIISAVLLFVPVVGEEVATAAGLASLARGIALASEVGNGALAIYDSVTDPGSAVINILGMLVGVGGITKVSRDAPGLTKVADVQRTMDAAAVGKFGSIFKSNYDKLQPVMKFCKWA